jgi:hypothetical protein
MTNGRVEVITSVLDLVRVRVLTRASIRLDRLVAGRVLAATMDGAIWGAPPRLVNSADAVTAYKPPSSN